MNKQRLQYIADNTTLVNDNDIAEIKQLIASFPYYALPHVVLAKILFEKEHYLFENALTQAAMRVTDREHLYHYIHGDNSADTELNDELTALDEEMVMDVVETPVETLEAPIEFAETENQIAESEDQPAEEIVIAAAIENKGTIKNNLTEFLDEVQVEEVAQIDLPTEIATELPEDEETMPVPATSKEFSEQLETTILESEEKVEDAAVENQAELASTLNIALNLRKHPVYNVEAFLQSEKQIETTDNSEERDFFYWLQHPQPQERQVVQKQEPVVENDSRINIIDQFIMSNPGISRPKKEFFNAENMARKSEHLDIAFVTETLANIYYEQGNIDLAISAYEKLSLQNPLKQAYFATLIEKIKKEKR